MKLKKIFLFAGMIALILVMPVIANGTREDGGAKTMRIGVVAKYQHEFYNTMFDGATQAANEYGATIECVSPSSPQDVMSQVQMVEDLIVKNIDILIVVPNQPATLINALDRAAEKGIVIVAADTDFDYEHKLCYAGTGNEAAGETVVTVLSKFLPANSNVVVMRGPLGGVSFDQRVAGVTRALERESINAFEIVDAESVSDKAAAKTEDLIQKYGSRLNAIICLDDNMTVGCVTAVRQSGKSGEILVTGFDAANSVLQMVASGDVLVDVAQNPYQMGYQSVKAAMDFIAGKDVPPIIDTGVQIITKDNVENFLK